MGSTHHTAYHVNLQAYIKVTHVCPCLDGPRAARQRHWLRRSENVRLRHLRPLQMQRTLQPYRRRHHRGSCGPLPAPTTRPMLRTINTRATCSRPAQATTPSPLQEDTPSPRARTTASNSRTRTRTPTEAVNTASGSSPTASSTPPRTPHRPFPHTHQRQLATPTLAMAPSLLPPVRLLRLLARRVKPASTTSPRTGPVTMPSKAAGLSCPTRLDVHETTTS